MAKKELTTSTAVRAMTIDSAAQAYSISPSTIRLAIRRGELKISRVGRRILLRPENLDRWVDGN